jgi:hypothetical protein
MGGAVSDSGFLPAQEHCRVFGNRGLAPPFLFQTKETA